MLFNSYPFILFFLPLCLLFFYRFKNYKFYVIFSFSLIFYGLWDFRFLPLILGTTIFNFIVSKYVSNKFFLIIAIITNLLLLIYFKYTNFILDQINLFSSNEYSSLNIILPLGISFFTFQQVGYLIELHQNKITRCKKFIEFAVFVTFFPQLIAGPIVGYSQIKKSFRRLNNTKFFNNISIGLFVFTIGLFKKIFIADNLSLASNAVFNASATYEAISFFETWLGVISYTMQIYFDFSAYSDM